MVDIDLLRLVLLEVYLFFPMIIRKSSHLMLPAIARRNETPTAQIVKDLGISETRHGLDGIRDERSALFS